MKTSLLALPLLLASSLALQAVQPQEVVYDSYGDFSLGTTRSTALSDLGVLSASPALETFAAFGPEEAGQVWAVVPDTGNAWFAATSPKGTVFRVTSGGKTEVVAKFPESHVYALAKNAKGDLFAATSPDGKIYRVLGSGKFEVWFEPKEKYVWALAFDKKGDLYAATGTNGKIYKITGKGQGAVFFDSDETHLRSLAFDGAGNLLAGSADSGLLYRIASDGSAVVLAATGRQEVNRIAVADDGTIWFAAVGAPHRRAALDAEPKNPSGLASLLGMMTNAPSLLPKPTAEGGQLGEGNASSQVWRLDKSLSPQPVWATSEAILTLDLDGAGVRVGTGGDGYVYRLDGKGRATRLLKLDGSAVTASAVASGGGAILASSNPARLYRVGAPGSGAGVYESDIADSHGFARWGAVHAEGPDAKFTLSTRSGNTPDPDASWYPWTPVRDGRSQSPAARYFQYKIEISAGGVDHIDLSYLPKNVAPKIEGLVILAPGLGYLPVTTPPVAPAAKSADQVIQAAGGGAAASSPVVRYQPVTQRGYRTAAWKATDPNGDTLRYTLYSRAAGDKEWRVLAKDQSDTVFSWDASGWPDGRYYLKVSASDESDNLPADALTDEAVSRLFLVDNTPPEIHVTSKGRKVEFSVADTASGIDNVTVSTDGNDFKTLVPSDGVVDPRSQRFSYALDEGEVLYIRAEDQAGNVASTLVKP
jgi:hypothetical protein